MRKQYTLNVVDLLKSMRLAMALLKNRTNNWRYIHRSFVFTIYSTSLSVSRQEQVVYIQFILPQINIIRCLKLNVKQHNLHGKRNEIQIFIQLCIREKNITR